VATQRGRRLSTTALRVRDSLYGGRRHVTQPHQTTLLMRMKIYKPSQARLYNAEFECGESNLLKNRARLRLELGNFRKVKIANFHCRNNHFEGFFSGGANRRAHQLNIAQHFQNRLIEPEISYCAGDFSLLHQK
jgi:hypothetical protein